LAGEEAEEGMNESGKVGQGMIMTDRLAHQRPDMLLRVEVRTGRGKEDGLDARVLLQKYAYRFTLVPACSVAQQQDRLGGIATEQIPQEVGGDFTAHLGAGQGKLMSGTDIERSVEMNVVALRSKAYYRGLTDRRPDAGGRRLKVEAHLIDGDDLSIRIVLQKVGQFF